MVVLYEVHTYIHHLRVTMYSLLSIRESLQNTIDWIPLLAPTPRSPTYEAYRFRVTRRSYRYKMPRSPNHPILDVNRKDLGAYGAIEICD